MSVTSPSSSSRSNPSPQFPTHNSPRCWFITDALNPLAIRLIRLLLEHGDHIAAGLPPGGLESEERSAEYRELITQCKTQKAKEGWMGRIRGIRCDGKKMSDCQAAIAEAQQLTGRIDILLLCTSEAVVGTVEELSTSLATKSLITDQFETNYFANVNWIKAALPHLREKQNGHILVLTSIAGHIGTPGMTMYCASTWALEGFCDSLAYEIAPFNIKVTIVQPNKEINVLTNKITFAPALEQYESQNNPAPMLRDILSHVVNLNPSSEAEGQEGKQKQQSSIISRYPRLRSSARDQLVMETVHALTAIGGHENPPARHIVGYEGVASVKEKLKTVSEELEDFVEVSLGVDISKEEETSAAAFGSGVGSGVGRPGSQGQGQGHGHLQNMLGGQSGQSHWSGAPSMDHMPR